MSVVIQIVSFQTTGKRVFRMVAAAAPLRAGRAGARSTSWSGSGSSPGIGVAIGLGLFYGDFLRVMVVAVGLVRARARGADDATAGLAAA